MFGSELRIITPRLVASLQHNLSISWGDTPARLNAPPNNLVQWISQDDYNKVYKNNQEFELEIAFDFSSSKYLCGLWIDGVRTKSKSLDIPAFIMSDSQHPAAGLIVPFSPGFLTTAGVSIAIAKAPVALNQRASIASVVVSEFEIYEDVPVGFLLLRCYAK